MIISSYSSFSGIFFGAPESEVVKQLGEPEKIMLDDVNEIEYFYDSLVVRFGAKAEGVLEGTWLPSENDILEINGFSFKCDNLLLANLFEIDKDAYDSLGFIVFYSLGISLTGFSADDDDDDEEKAITIFKEGHWDEFRERAVKVSF